LKCRQSPSQKKTVSQAVIQVVTVLTPITPFILYGNPFKYPPARIITLLLSHCKINQLDQLNPYGTLFAMFSISYNIADKRELKMDVLIVDDNEEIIAVLQGMLESDNHRTRGALNGKDGYLAYLDFNPDVIITDIQMQGKDGFELVKDIREHNSKIKTVYMSGAPYLFGPKLNEEKKIHNSGFLEKPFSSAELKQVLSLVRD